MDDAGGGRRGLRPVLTADLCRAVSRAYGYEVAVMRDLGGSANLNAIVVAQANRQLVVRAYRPHVTIERVAAIQAARQRLSDSGVPIAPLVRTRAGDAFVVVGRNIIEVEQFVPSDMKMDSLDRVKVALPTLALVHDALCGVDFGEAARDAVFVNYVAPAALVERTRIGTDRIRAWAPTAEEAELAKAADRLAIGAAEAQELLALPPVQLVHGDFWDNNVLLEEGQVVLVADLDFMNERWRIDDLAVTLHFMTSELEDQPPSDLMRSVAALVDAYDQGASTPLSAIERAALPLAMARQPLWSLGVWAALLDDEQAARRHLHGQLAATQHALDILGDLDKWQDALA